MIKLACGKDMAKLGIRTKEGVNISAFHDHLAGCERCHPAEGVRMVTLFCGAVLYIISVISQGGAMVSHGRFRVVLFLGTVIVSVCMLFVAATESLARSRSYCEGYARDYANRNSQYATQGGALGGAARGAAGGALFGAIAGDAGVGAAVGAGLGAIRGGARRANSWQYYYDQAYSDCIRGR